MTEDEMVGWHHQLDGYEFEYAQAVGDGQGGLACCSPWGCKSWMRLSKCTELIRRFHSSSFINITAPLLSSLLSEHGNEPVCRDSGPGSLPAAGRPAGSRTSCGDQRRAVVGPASQASLQFPQRQRAADLYSA